jgi:hypothetical protein
VVTGSFPTTGSRSLLFNNEAPVYGQQPTETLFGEYWNDYITLLYSPKTRLITAKAIIPLADYFDMELNDIVNWRGNYYHLRAINEYNLKTGDCSIQLLGPIIADTFGGINPFTTTTTTTTAAPTTTTTSTTTTTTEGPTTTTTTVSPTSCACYIFENPTEDTLDVTYTVCEGDVVTVSIAGGLTVTDCVQYLQPINVDAGIVHGICAGFIQLCATEGDCSACASATTTTTSTSTTTTTAAPETVLNVYAKYVNSNGNLQVQINGGPIEELGALTTDCVFITSFACNVSDEFIFSDVNTKTIAGSTTICPDSGFGCVFNYEVLVSGPQDVYLTIDGSINC